MGNLFSTIKNVATIHDAAVDAGVVKNNKIGKYMPKQFSDACTVKTLASIAKASNHLKRVQGVAVKVVYLGATLGGAYLATQQSKPKDISARKCEKISQPPPNITLKNNFNAMFEYYKDESQKQMNKSGINTKSIVDAVKEKNLSVKND